MKVPVLQINLSRLVNVLTFLVNACELLEETQRKHKKLEKAWLYQTVLDPRLLVLRLPAPASLAGECSDKS